MRRSAALLAASCLLWGSACGEDEQKKGKDTSKTAESAGAPASDSASDGDKDRFRTQAADSPAATDTALDPAVLAQKVGVEPGPIAYDAKEGAAAVVARAEGKVEIRRVGTETWEKTKVETQLREGDQIRAAEGGLATVTLVDETSVEVAEESALAIGSRKATEDPASSAAVLYGVARFTVAGRAPGEGPFLVFTPGGVIATKGTVYTAGVAASGVTRVGVEDGEVEVAGGAKLAAPVDVKTGHAVVISPEGEVGDPEALGEADWGAWRDGAEANLEARTAAEFHARRAEALEAELEAAYAELEAQTAAAEAAEAKAEAAEKANDPSAYQSAAPEVGAAVDASFAMSLRLGYLSNAMLGHAYVADALYLRHPDVVAVIEPARPHLAAAVLWHKKYHAVADLHVEPLRAYYYVHHPVGRTHAKLVAYPIPPFYARIKLDYGVPAVSSRVKVAVFQPPLVRPAVRVRKRVYVRAPTVGWYAGVKMRVRPAPARVRWYVKPSAPRARVVFGAAPPATTVKVRTVFGAAPPRPRAEAVVGFGGGATARDRRSRLEVRDHRAGAVVRGGPRERPGVGAPPAVEVRDHRGAPPVEVRDHRGAPPVGAGVRIKPGAGGPDRSVRDHRMRGGAAIRGGDSDASAGAAGRVKMKGPKAQPPKVKVKAKSSVKVKGGIRVGN